MHDLCRNAKVRGAIGDMARVVPLFVDTLVDKIDWVLDENGFNTQAIFVAGVEIGDFALGPP